MKQAVDLASATPAPAGARCHWHAETPAAVACGRCGTFVCSGCVVRDQTRWVCPDCRRYIVDPLVRGSPVAYFALLLSIGLLWITMMGLPFQLGALGLAYFEEGRIDRGEASPGGRDLVRTTKRIAWTGLALSLIRLPFVWSHYWAWLRHHL